MKNLISILIGALFQLILFFYLAYQPTLSPAIIALIISTSIIVAFLVLSDDTKVSTSKLSWITIILTIPFLGVILYLIFGMGHMSNYRKQILEDARLRYIDQQDENFNFNELDFRKKSLLKYLYNMKYSSSTLHHGGKYKTYMFGEEKFKDMLSDFNQAKSYIHIEYFIIKDGILLEDIIKVLTNKVKDGVEVRITCDYAGSYRLEKETINRIKKAGIQFRQFNKPKVTVFSKVSNFRDHRKIVIIDGKIAYTGGLNIADEYIDLDPYFGHWQDFHIRITNTLAVHDFETFFAQTWYFLTRENLFKVKYYPEIDIAYDGYIYPYVDGPDTVQTYIKDMFFKAIMLANKEIFISTPYLIPDSDVYNAIITQANSGIKITILTPGLPDKKLVKLTTESYYPDLIKAGVNIIEYNGFIHAKKLLIDDDIAIIGTANFDMRSFNLSFEVCCLVFDSSIIKEVRSSFDYEIENGKLIPEEAIKNVNLFKRLLQVILRVFAPLF